MIKVLGFLLAIGGVVALVLGVLGIFGSNLVAVSPWALTILGFIFFIAGIGILKRRPDTDETPTTQKKTTKTTTTTKE